MFNLMIFMGTNKLTPLILASKGVEKRTHNPNFKGSNPTVTGPGRPK
jgi:hypothetical protein